MHYSVSSRGRARRRRRARACGSVWSCRRSCWARWRPGRPHGRSALVVACQALARSLDPHSVVITAEEQQRTLGLSPENEGLGLELKAPFAGPAVVEVVYLGGPAQRAGLRPGDVLTHLDGA